jgi:hypothetical protein
MKAKNYRKDAISVQGNGIDETTPVDGDALVYSTSSYAPTQVAMKTHSHAISDVTDLQTSLDGKESSFTKNTAFNKDFGAVADTVCEGNDPRLSDDRTPLAHTHDGDDITSSVADALALNGNSSTYYETPKRTIFLTGAGGIPSTTNGNGGPITIETTTNLVMVSGGAFAAGETSLYQNYSVVMPANYDGTQAISAKFYWTTNDDSPSGTIIWGIRAQAETDGDSLDGTWGTAATVTDTILGKLLTHISDATTFTPGGTPNGGKLLQFQVYRDGSDTSANDAILLGVLLQYTTSQYGDA